MNDFLKEIFEKYYSYKNKIYVNIDYIHITCHNGIFYKYPQSYTQQNNHFMKKNKILFFQNHIFYKTINIVQIYV